MLNASKEKKRQNKERGSLKMEFRGQMADKASHARYRKMPDSQIKDAQCVPETARDAVLCPQHAVSVES